jgi:Bacterial Ig-like domain (group 2)
MNYLTAFRKKISLQRRSRVLVVTCCAVFTSVWTSCSPAISGFNLNDDKTLITVVPDGSTVNVGEQLQFTVELTKKGVTTNAEPTLFNWVSSNLSLATVDDHGRALGIAPGNLRIQAQSKSQPSNAGGASLNVQVAPPITTLAAMPEAVLVRYSGTDREVSYAVIGARHLLRTSTTFPDGSVSQREKFAPEIGDGGWLALDSSGPSLCVLSRGTRQVLVFAVDPRNGEVTGAPRRIRVDADVFAIAAEGDTLRLQHLSGTQSRIQMRHGE